MAPRKKSAARRPRRKPDTGAIRFRKGRTFPYEAAFPLGRGRYRYDYFATTEEAAKHLDLLTAERDSKETPRNITGGSQRVDTFLQAWLNTKRGHIKTKTLLSYQYLCELAISEIGMYRLDRLSRERAEEMLLYFAEKGFQNVSQMRAVLRQAFQYTLEEDYIKKNPFQKAKAPPVERRKGIALTQGQRAGLLACAATEDRMRLDAAVIPLCPLWHLYSRLGLRKGEGMGTLWANLRQTKRGAELTISQQYTNVGSKTEKSTPKAASQRTIPLPDDLYDLLMAHKVAQIQRAASDPAWEQSGLIFCDAHGRRLSVWYVQNRWEKLRARSPISTQTTMHDLRHTADYLMESSGVPRSARMALVGHKTTAMDRHYTDHADMDAMRAAIERSA